MEALSTQFCISFTPSAGTFSAASLKLWLKYLFGREPGPQIRAFQICGTDRNSAPGNTRGRPVTPLHDQPTKRRPTNDTSSMKKFLEAECGGSP